MFIQSDDLILMKRQVLLLFLSLVSSCAVSENNFFSLSGPIDKLRSKILTKTPISSDVIVVSNFIKNHPHEKITSLEYSLSAGVKIRGVDTSQTMSTVGKHSIEVLLGTYSDPKRFFLLDTDVYAQWAFDENNKLIDVFVHKYNQPP